MVFVGEIAGVTVDVTEVGEVVDTEREVPCPSPSSTVASKGGPIAWSSVIVRVVDDFLTDCSKKRDQTIRSLGTKFCLRYRYVLHGGNVGAIFKRNELNC